MNFMITIHGPLPDNWANRLWTHVEKANSNLTVLDKSAYIYGNCDDRTINQLAVEAGKTGYLVEVERG